MTFELFVALRYLKAKRKQALVSVVSVISILGITAGVMALVIALALSTGFREDIQAKIVGATSHINLMQLDGGSIQQPDALIQKLRGVPRVTGAAPAIFSQVFVSAVRSQGAFLKGIDPILEREISDFFSHIVEGDPNALEKDPEAGNGEGPPLEHMMIGKEMARTLGVKVNETVSVLFPRGRLTPFGRSALSVRRFRIAAIFESGLWDYDSNWVYTGIGTARRLFGLPAGSASVLQFRIDDLEGAGEVADEIRVSAGSGFTTTTWIELNRPLFSALKLEKLALFITIGLIVFVASLNIVTTLILLVLDKQRDIAVLTAMGATSRTIMTVFMLQGLVIGVVGTVLGAGLGMGAAWTLDTYKLIPLEPEVYSIPFVPFHIKVWDVVLVSATALLISFLATLYPARKAALLDPVEVLRHE